MAEMTVFCDTSVLVAACIHKHPHYERARPILESIASGEIVGFVSTHSLAEAFSALTSVPITPRILPSEARDIIATNIRKHFQLVAVTAEMYQRAVEVCVGCGLGGGKVYDALLFECARLSQADRIYTFNLQDFRRLAPDLVTRISAP
ncbi:MAG: type II toxin-antitoxin system VapC family toxin [bacterium]|jgi:predicted nucleic acid-binding protein